MPSFLSVLPVMALINGAAHPPLRGTFMSLSASFQQAAMGLGANGVMHHYNIAGYLAAATILAALWVSGKVRQRG